MFTTRNMKLRKIITAMLMSCCTFFLLCQSSLSVEASRATGLVKNQILNVRSAASTTSSIVCKLSQGTKVTIIEETTGSDGMKWYDVYFTYSSQATEGYIRSDLLTVSGASTSTTASSATTTTTTASGSKYVKPNAALVRTYASTNADIRSRLLQGTIVTIISSKSGDDGKTWYKVSYQYSGSSLNGYIRSDLLSDTNPVSGTGTTTSGTATSSSATSIAATIKPTTANVRTYASTSGDIRSKLSSGTGVTIIAEKTGADGQKWYKISYTYNGASMTGYVRYDILTLGTSSASTSGSTSTSSGSSTSTGSGSVAVAEVRTYASPYADIRTTLTNGTKVTIVSEKTGEDGEKWTKISFTKDGTTVTGYVKSSVLK